MITATFSNGHTDTYKGTREVKAAWALIRKDTGETLASGHSLDMAKARKTAEGKIGYSEICKVLGRDPKGDSHRPTRNAMQSAHHDRWARTQGFKNWAEAHKAYQADAALAREMITIEVIAL